MININARVIKLVRNTVREYSSSEIPDFDEICTGLGLVAKEMGAAVNDGMTIKRRTLERTMVINSRIQSQERKQFTRFHELMHYLIDRDDELISILHEVTWGQDGEYDRQIERLCNIGAAEFLMPREKFIELYKDNGFNVELIPFAASRFRSSAIATTIQLAQVAPHSCIAAICEYGLIPNERSPEQRRFLEERDSTLEKKLYTIYSASSQSMKYSLARYAIIPNDHLIHEAYLEGQPLKGESYFPFRTGKRPRCFCETLPDKNRVYVVLHWDPPPTPNPDQLTFF